MFVYFVLSCLFTENAIIYMEFPVPITLIQSGQTNKHTHTHTQQSRFNNIDIYKMPLWNVISYASVFAKKIPPASDLQ